MSAPIASASVQRVQAALAGHGLADRVRELSEPTRTAADAARVVGCHVSQIVKSLVFRAGDDSRALMVVASGANRVAEDKLAAITGGAIAKADAAFVREHTGFAIGGVAPLGHARPMEVLVDEDLMAHQRIWAAAGTPNSLFELTPQELLRVSGGRVADVKA